MQDAAPDLYVPLCETRLLFRRRADVVRYLKGREWEPVKESAIGDLWYHRGYCPAAVDMQTAMALTLAREVRALQDENDVLREKMRKLKARLRYSVSQKE